MMIRSFGERSEERLSLESLSMLDMIPATAMMRGICRFMRPKVGESPEASSSRFEYDLETIFLFVCFFGIN